MKLVLCKLFQVQCTFYGWLKSWVGLTLVHVLSVYFTFEHYEVVKYVFFNVNKYNQWYACSFHSSLVTNFDLHVSFAFNTLLIHRFFCAVILLKNLIKKGFLWRINQFVIMLIEWIEFNSHPSIVFDAIMDYLNHSLVNINVSDMSWWH